MNPPQPTILCVRISCGRFLELVIPAALYSIDQMGELISTFEGLGNVPDVEYVWR